MAQTVQEFHALQRQPPRRAFALVNPGATPMSPDPGATKSTLTDTYNANNLITAYCHALNAVQLNWVTGPDQPADPPDWFNALQTGLTDGQTHANTWIETLGPQIFATVPQSIINYSNTFTAASNDILAVLAALPQNADPTPDEQKNINSLVGAILDVLQTESQTLTDVQASLAAFATNVQNVHTAISTGQNSAEQAVVIDAGKLIEIQGKITEIQGKITADSKLAMDSEIGIGVGIFIAVVGIALIPVTAGGSAVVIAVGVAVTGLGIAGTVIFSAKVKQDLADLVTEQNELDQEQKQVSALQGMVNSVQNLVTANESAATALSAVLDTWTVLEAKLSAVQSQLQKVEAGGVRPILESLDLQVAQTDWAQLTAFCQNMQNNPVTVQPVITDPGSSPATATPNLTLVTAPAKAQYA